jgi:hypothetical protein
MRRFPLSLAPLFGLILSSMLLVVALEGCGTTPASAPAASMARLGAASTDQALPLFSPGAGALDALWPNDDGRFWEYQLVQTTTPTTVGFYPPGVQPPPAPSVWEIAALLRSESQGRRTPPAGGPTATGMYRLAFDGRVTTKSGAEGQNLTETLLPNVRPEGRSTSAARSALAGASLPAFWAHLAAARPDLAPAVRKRFGLATNGTIYELSRPILLHGGAWEKTAEHIGTYGDLNLDLAWLYLVADVRAGSTFDLQLVPDLAEDVWLHALVLPRRYTTRPRPGPGTVQVLYLIDYGVSLATGPTGEDLGTFRAVEYGTVSYVPGVGPAAVFDRADFPGPFGPSSGIRIEYRGTLSATGPQASPLIGLR